MGKHLGKSSFQFETPPTVRAWASAVGQKEAEGPLGQTFDSVSRDPYWGQKTWEQAEQTMQQTVLRRVLRKGELSAQDLGAVFSGDLLNQCIGSSFCLQNTGIPHVGLYGACSTMAQSLCLAAMAVGGGFLKTAAAMTSSHFCSAERQYRFPLGYGGQRTPESQWTVTGAGALLLEEGGKGPRVTGCTLGTVESLGVTDASNMGAAMAPAALSTLRAHFEDFSASPQDYDLIVTGDLGLLGRDILKKMGEKEGMILGDNYQDCGCMIFDPTVQAVGMGGSGCGCSASVLCGALLNLLSSGRLRRLLFCGTGALLSPLTTQQGLPIPGICHAVVLEAPNP